MNTLNTINIEALAEQIVNRLTVEVEASGRHVHLSRADLDTLFGPGLQLTRVKDLSQPGQFAAAQRVTLEGPRGSIPNVVVLGPERKESQVEISLTDVRLDRGVIAAKRHIHMTPADAARFGVENGQEVRLKCLTGRPLTFEGVEVRVSLQFATVAHIDYDEANACGFKKGDRALILPEKGGCSRA